MCSRWVFRRTHKARYCRQSRVTSPPGASGQDCTIVGRGSGCEHAASVGVNMTLVDLSLLRPCERRHASLPCNDIQPAVGGDLPQRWLLQIHIGCELVPSAVSHLHRHACASKRGHQQSYACPTHHAPFNCTAGLLNSCNVVCSTPAHGEVTQRRGDSTTSLTIMIHAPSRRR